MSDIKKMDIKEFQEMGLLLEVNRLFFHPLGLALSISVDSEGNKNLDGILDSREDPEGYIYADSLSEELKPKIEKAQEFMKIQHEKRKNTLGYIIQEFK